MAVFPLINSFNAGEMSPYLIGRVDLDKYGSGCQRMENMRALPYGGAVMRPGTEFVWSVIGSHRLKEFIYSTTTSYILAFGHENLKIFQNGAYIGVAFDVATPYDATHVFELQFLQINDIMYIVHPSYAVRKLSRVSATAFTLSEVVFNAPALLDFNTTTTTIMPSGTTGSITLQASAAIFNAAHVGSYWQISHFREATDVNQPLTADGTSSSIAVRGGWTIRSFGGWTATLLIERSNDGGGSWEVIATYARAEDGNVDDRGNEENSVLLRLRVADYVSDAGDGPYAVLAVTSDYVDGLVQITAFTDTDTVTATVINPLASTDATTRWSEGAWSAFRGYPKCVGIFEERIYYANTAYEPQRIWGSRVGDYEDFELSSDDDAAVSYAIADVQQNPIQWLLGERSLLFATTAAQWTLSGGESGEPVTPSNVKVQRQPSNLGAEAFQPVSLPGITLFLQRGGRKFRELFFQFVESSYSAQDVTLLAEHITSSGIKQFAASNHPDSIAYCVRNDGEMAVMVYERGQANGGAGNLVAWSRYVTDGEFESVAIIPGEIEDEVWAVVARRTDGGATVRCVERFRQRLAFLEDRSDWYFLDCGRTVDVYALKAITSVERIAYGPTFDVDGTTSQRVAYRVNSTLHGLTNGQNVRIAGTGFEEINGGVFKVCTNNTGTFYLGMLAEDHPQVVISAITQANPGVVTTTTNHEVDAMTPVFIRAVVGMTTLNGNIFGATGLTATTFGLGVDTSVYPAYVSGGTVDLLFGSVQAVGYDTIEANGSATVVTNAFQTASVLGTRDQTLVADGSPVEDSVQADTFNGTTLVGTGTSDTYGSVLHTGLPYFAYVTTNPVETALQSGASNSVKKRIARITMRVNNSVGAKIGSSATNLETIPFRSTAQNMDQAVPGLSDLIEVAPPMDIETVTSVTVSQQEPLNLEILFLAVKAEYYP